MKKAILSLFVLAGLTILLGTGCTSVVTSGVGEQVNVDMPLKVVPQVEPGAQKISGKADINVLFGFICWGDNGRTSGVDFGKGNYLFWPYQFVARDAATYEALNGAKADILLAPKYVIKEKNYFIFRQVSCTVDGFPGYVKSVKISDK